MNKMVSLGVLTLCSVGLVACSGNNKATDENKAENTSTSQKKKEGASFKSDTLKIDMATLKIISTEVLPADENLLREKPQLAIIYEVTNNSNEPISASTVWIACMGLTQNSEKLTVGMTPQDEKFTEYTEHQLDDIKPNDTTKAIISYDLNNSENPVTLKVTQGMAGKELGEKTINLK
ncbi:hypothetical protein A5821_000388 [Enterococcus sp. 7F3_DIV0205]|uniref:DUF5067 domain-containing protein n=1 Tax=Candidatus Enterococcus palustris TaxID=1834189 RepID=A0AAQ3W5Q5_9ENTE|nr:DUF5067 domain-containing protein [Enterococcus sp. 7F3_DIV0205]OTN84801.1 hypothetical protein A5821_000730 [Enterococcus sp. 7F3_DIV0205]